MGADAMPESALELVELLLNSKSSSNPAGSSSPRSEARPTKEER